MVRTRHSSGAPVRKSERVKEAEAQHEEIVINSSPPRPVSSAKGKKATALAKSAKKSLPTPVNSSRPTSKNGGASRPGSRSTSGNVNTTPGKITKRQRSSDAISEADVMKINDPTSLLNLINNLVSTDRDRIFDEYRTAQAEALEKDDEVIGKLSDKLDSQQELITGLLKHIKNLERSTAKRSLDDDDEDDDDQNIDASIVSLINETPSKSIPYNKINDSLPDLSHANNTSGNNTGQITYESPIRKKRLTTKNRQFTNEPATINEDQITQELKTINIVMDMQELLTGNRIINYEEDSDKFYFDVKQVSTEDVKAPLSIEYRLILSKEFNNSAEVNYVPTFLNDLLDDDNDDDIDSEEYQRSQTASRLLKILPEYFRDSLSFPFGTLPQFYAKMGKALNKGSKL